MVYTLLKMTTHELANELLRHSDSFITITVNGREYNIDRLQRVKTHANIDDSMCYYTLVAKEY